MKILSTLVMIIFGLFTLQVTGCASAPKERALKAQDVEPLYLKGNKLVVVAHPNCHFSEMAFEQIDQETKDYINNHGLILTQVRQSYAESDFEAIREWNNEHHELIHVPVQEGESFSKLNLNSTPQFYFFKDGQLVAKVVGWPKDGSRQKDLKDNINKFRKSKALTE